MARRTNKPFTMVRRSLWNSSRFKSLPDDDARYLYLYFLCCPHQTATGCFLLKDSYALGDLSLNGAIWTVEKYRRLKAILVEYSLVLADETTSEILITRWWKDNGPNNDSWLSGATKQCGAIKSPLLRDAAEKALAAAWENYLDSKSHGLKKNPTATGAPASAEIRIDAVKKRLATA